jgi:peptidoglycan/LPS O-acetylase OafA/YrhL
MKSRQQLYALTSLRGIAAWWVVIYHFRELLPSATPAAIISVAGYGWLAVDLFFILSGFVLALTHGKQFEQKVSGYVRFLALRLARIYPLHLLVMVLYLSVPLASVLFSQQQPKLTDFDFLYYLQSLFLVQNWGFNDKLLWNVPAWSISTEMFAYLFFPMLTYLVLRFSRGIFSTLVVNGAILVLLAVLAWKLVPSLGADIEHFGLLRCLFEFAAGIALHRLMATCPPNNQASWLALTLFAVCALLMALNLAADFLVMPFGFSCLIYGLATNEHGPAKLLRASWLQMLGELSYATYLIHFLVKRWVLFLLVSADSSPTIAPLLTYLLVTLVGSYIAFHYIEMPAQRWLRSKMPLGEKRTAYGEPARSGG